MPRAPEPLRPDAATRAAAGYGFCEPTYTQVPNDLWAIMPDLSDPELRILLIVIRATLGYHQTTSGSLSLTDMQRCSGLCRTSVNNAAHRLRRAGLITLVRRYPCSQWRLNITQETFVKLKAGETTQTPDQRQPRLID